MLLLILDKFSLGTTRRRNKFAKRHEIASCNFKVKSGASGNYVRC